MRKVEFKARKVPSSVEPISFDDSLCIGCGQCAAVCQVDVMLPAAGKGRHPEVMYPGECYYCGSCVMACPVKGAIRLRHPLMNQARFVEIEESPEPSKQL